MTPPVAGQLLPPARKALPWPGSRVAAGEVLALVQPHLVGSELVTFLSCQQQIYAQLPEWDLDRISASYGGLYEPSDAPGTFVPILGEGGGLLV